MAQTFNIRLKLVLGLAAKKSVTAEQLRAHLADFIPQASTWITGVVSAAPPAAEASLDSLTWRLKVDPQGTGLWSIYPKPLLCVSVADHITQEQVNVYLRGFYDDAKTKIRALVAAAPPGAKIQILDWHVHRFTELGVAESYDEVEP